MGGRDMDQMAEILDLHADWLLQVGNVRAANDLREAAQMLRNVLLTWEPRQEPRTGEQG